VAVEELGEGPDEGESTPADLDLVGVAGAAVRGGFPNIVWSHRFASWPLPSSRNTYVRSSKERVIRMNCLPPGSQPRIRIRTS